MQGLTGLTAIAGYQVQIDAESQATPEERMGGVADPKHAIPGETARPYSWESKSTQAAAGLHGPYGPENQMLDDPWWLIEPAGMDTDDPYMDQTPSRRAGPWPKGIASPVPSADPDDIAFRLRQSMAIHGIKARAGKRSLYTPAGDIQNDEWNQLDELNPGHTELVDLPPQSKSSGFMWGTRDRTQSFARQNEYGFDSAHMMRRYASGPIPGNTMWLKPGGRPLAKSLAGPARPAVGPTSPFSGDDLGSAFSIDGAMLQNVPSEYVGPAQPTLSTPVISDESNGSIVEWY